MKEPINKDDLNRILLKPRIYLRLEASKEEVLELFHRRLKKESCRFPSRIVDHHVVIDVPKGEEHFWSPQLHVEVEQDGEAAVVRGVLGPKPKIWTFFIFLHFIVGATFFVFFVIFYSKMSLDQDYGFSMTMCILMPILWVLLYFFGQLGKRFGYRQMTELHGVMSEALRDKKLIAS